MSRYRFIVFLLFALLLLAPLDGFAQSAAAADSTSDTVTLTLDADAVQVGDKDADETAPELKGPTSTKDAVNTLLASSLAMLKSFLQALPNIVIGLVILVATGVAASLVLRFSKKLFGRLHLKESLRDLFSQLIYIALWFIGILLAAGVVFPGFGFAQIIATAGLASIAIGFAFKDIFENFFAGILILWNYPFQTGDFIEIEGHGISGRVEDIWIRITLIRRPDGQLIIVPNSTIYTNPVRVITSQRTRRIELVCGVAYGEDVDESRTVIRRAVESCELVNKDKEVQVFATEFADSSINFAIRWWTGSRPIDEHRSRDQVVSAVKRALDEAGIEIPFPYRTLTFKKGDPFYMAKDDTGE